MGVWSNTWLGGCWQKIGDDEYENDCHGFACFHIPGCLCASANTNASAIAHALSL
jgi:hypothetical protein